MRSCPPKLRKASNAAMEAKYTPTRRVEFVTQIVTCGVTHKGVPKCNSLSHQSSHMILS